MRSILIRGPLDELDVGRLYTLALLYVRSVVLAYKRATDLPPASKRVEVKDRDGVVVRTMELFDQGHTNGNARLG